MERLTHKRENGIKRGYWSPNKKQELVDRLAMYEDREDAKHTNVLGKWIPISEHLPERYLSTTHRSLARSILRWSGMQVHDRLMQCGKGVSGPRNSCIQYAVWGQLQDFLE